jgi:nitroimidazol reductase NimA-like FMN-containing flavoprotein (pyridoxamine 5'-phosphate oxidase superfamily)
LLLITTCFEGNEKKRDCSLRRKDREIKEIIDLKDIVNRADVCRIAFAVNNTPYIVTMNFGYTWNTDLILYFHCAKEGRKLDLMRQNNRVCLEMDIDHELQLGETPCKGTMKYKSLIGYGTLEIVTDPDERKKGLDLIMDKYGFAGKKEYDEKLFNMTEILRLKVTEISGKRRA